MPEFVELFDYARITGVDTGVSVVGALDTALDSPEADYVLWTGATTFGAVTGVDVIFPPFDIPSGATLPGTSTPGVKWWLQFNYSNPGTGAGQPVGEVSDLGVTLVPPGFHRVTAADNVVGDDSTVLTATADDIPYLRDGLVARLMSDAIGSDEFRCQLFRLWVAFDRPSRANNPLRRYPPVNNGGFGPTRHWPRTVNRRAGGTY